MLLNLLPDHVIVHTLVPLAPDRSRVTCDWLFAPEAVARPGFDPADTVALFDRVNRQDWEVCEWVQAGVRSRAFAAGGVYVPIEQHIRGFNDWVLEQPAEPGHTAHGRPVAATALEATRPAQLVCQVRSACSRSSRRSSTPSIPTDIRNVRPMPSAACWSGRAIGASSAPRSP